MTPDDYRQLKGPNISIGSTASPPRSARWNEEMDERSARRNHETGCHDGPWRSFALVSLGCARIPMMVRSKICSTKRPDTLMQLSRSPAQLSALRRTAGPYKLAPGDGLMSYGTDPSRAFCSRTLLRMLTSVAGRFCCKSPSRISEAYTLRQRLKCHSLRQLGQE